ncbi:unnamed protein product [Pedinophyceae sp. YPF-701]|nr:unnamed protein product [Pedinophyceae sp. YPF-701]
MRTDGVPDPCSLLDLPQGVLQDIAERLERPERIAFASCARQCMPHVLAAPLACLRIPQSGTSLLDDERLRAACKGAVVSVLDVGVDIDHLDALHRAAAEGQRDAAAVMQFLILQDAIRRLKLACNDVTVVPEGLSHLQWLDLTQCRLSPIGFLPPSSLADLRVLKLNRTPITALPEGLVSLERLEISTCIDLHFPLPESSTRRLRSLETMGNSITMVATSAPALTELDVSNMSCYADGPDAWIPDDARGTLRVLRMLGTNGVARVPGGLRSLECLTLDMDAHVAPLDPDGWLLASSVKNLRVLRVSGTGIVRMPPDMHRLEVLEATYCTRLEESWLPSTSRQRIRELNMTGAKVSQVPAGLESLESLDVSRCSHFQATREVWLPESTGWCLTKLCMCSSSIKSVPDHLRELRLLNASMCKCLHGSWLPPQVGRQLRVLQLSQTHVRRLPGGLEALEVLDVSHCRHLDHTWLPHDSSRRLMVLEAHTTNLSRLPDDLEHLEQLDLSWCELAENWLPPGSRGMVASLRVAGTCVERVPPGLANLARLDVCHCNKLEPGAWLPPSSAERLQKVYAHATPLAEADAPAHVQVVRQDAQGISRL